jgi:trimeric autotransporter adhesin
MRNQPQRRRLLGNFSARALVIGIVLAAIGLARGHQACAQGGVITSGLDAVLVTLANLTDAQISNKCGRMNFTTANETAFCILRYEYLRDEAQDELKSEFVGPRLPFPFAARSRVETSGSSTSTFAPTLESSVPALPFLGNLLTVLSWIPNATTAADATDAYAVGLTRQSNCSLDEEYVLPGAGLPDAEYLTSLTGAQDYFHQISGLTTTPDVFANGCAPQALGLPASNTFWSLGTTPDGASIVAQLTSPGLYVTITDLTANTVTNTQVTSGSDPGAFYGVSLRNNGIMDLVETGLTDPANSSPATAVLLGNGDGTFQKPVYYDVSANSYATAAGFTVDDVNGDGIPDIVVLNGTTGTNNGAVIPVTGTVTTLIGKGDGTFTTGPVSNLTWTDSLQVATGVFKTGDVKDLLVGGTVLFGAGNGSFTQGPTNNALANLNINTASVGGNAIGSLRNNGKLDVVVSEPGFVSIFYGNGDGTFQTGPSYAGLPDYMPVSITDVDGDGNPDILLGSNSGGVYTEGGYDTPLPMFQILMGRGDGTFVDSPVYNQGTYGVQGNANQEIASADFNGDSKPDVLVFSNSSTGGSSSLVMLPGNGTGALGTPVTSSINTAPYLLVGAKMYHDTMPDAVLAGNVNSGAQLSVLINQGNGTFAGEQDYSLASAPVSLAVGDFNGDGIPDVAVGMSGGVDVLFGQANGTLGSPVQVDSSANPIGLAAGSLTTDGRTDLVVADQATGTLHVYLGNANETFTTVTAPTTGATNLGVAALGDLNNDGKLDLIVTGFIPGSSGNPNVSNVYTFLGNGDGTFKAANTLAIASNDVAVTSMALADFNNSGNLGVVVGNPDDYTEVLLGNGDGTLTETSLALGQRPATVAAADLLGNGYPEILVGESDTQGQGYSLTVFQNQSTDWVAATTTPTVTVTPSPSSITTAQSTMVTVAVSGGTGYPTPTGSVTLSSGAYTSAAATLTSGSAIITVPAGSLAVKTDTLTATYTPDSTSSSVYNSATGTNSVTVTAAPPPSFALTNNGNITMSPGATTSNTSTISVTPSGGFTGAVALTCAITPTAASDPATCALSPASVTLSGASAGTSTLTLATTAATTAALDLPKRGGIFRYAAGGASLACVLLLVSPTRLSRWRTMLGMIVLSAFLAVGLVSCGGGGGGGSGKNGGGGGTGNPGTTAGTYTVTVTGTSGSIAETTTVALTVN